MRHRSACCAAVLVIAAAPLALTQMAPEPAPSAQPGAVDAAPAPLAGLAKLTEAAKRPELADLALYLEIRAAAAAGDSKHATSAARSLLDRDPGSIWGRLARLDVGRVRHRTGDLPGSLQWLDAAADTFPEGERAAVVTDLLRAEVEHELGDDEAALELAGDLRDSRPHGLAVNRARRLVERIRERPDEEPSPTERLAEAELRLAEGDAQGAQREALVVLGGPPTREARDHALWIQARAARDLGTREAAEALCLALATSEPGPYGARALAEVARWRWNEDDDAGALRLFRDLARRFPGSREAPEALYAIGRIQQESAAYDDAFRSYTAFAERYPSTRTAEEARWRAGWVRYLAGDHEAAAESFGRLAVAGERETRVAAEYWEARSLEQIGDPEAASKMAHVAEEHPATFYGMLASARLGVAPRNEAAPPDAERPAFPDGLTGQHATRARIYNELGLHRLARRELDALAPSVSTNTLLQAYAAVEAPGPALRLARSSVAGSRRYLYPLGYWEVVRPMAESRGLDPLLVVALIRQESLFFPDAVSPADAHGLMQLLPGTARELATSAGLPAPDREALHQVSTNVDLGTSLLRRLLDRYGGSRVKALAAYNAGEEAVAKWERRYGGRPDDEFVELISFRETRDYVKSVLTHYEVYRQLYAPSASATSLGSPSKEPLDMITMTSPDRADDSR
jgi:soluble lytic murein transglycosylase